MKRRFLLLALALVSCAAVPLHRAWIAHQAEAVRRAVREGDLVFQACPSAAGIFIRLATGSLYDHVGIVLPGGSGWMVCEAVDEVRLTPLAAGVGRGLGGLVAVRRLREEPDRPTDTALLRPFLARALGKPYDFLFSGDDSSFYCSGLAWQAYRLGLSVELCPLRRLAEYHIDSWLMQKALHRLYGPTLPLETRLVAPADLLRSPRLQPISL